MTLFRVLAEDAKEPYQTSDSTLIKYIREAEKEGAERSLYLKLGDDYNFLASSGKASYDVDTEIIFIDRVKLSGAVWPLVKTTKRELDFSINNWDTATGEPKYWFQEQDILTLYPVPTQSYTVMLSGSRRPVSDMETPERYHESLVYWCLYRHFSSPDVDVQNPGLSLKYKADFDKAFGHRRSAQWDAVYRDTSEFSSMAIHPFA
jgi:hypothetical protein